MAAVHVFVSYSHLDSRWFAEDSLIPGLERALQMVDAELWFDRQRLLGGDDWREEIEQAINRAHVCLLLVSRDFLASPFIREEELPRIERRSEEGELAVIPILVGKCDWEAVPFLNKPQMLPGKPTPLIQYVESPAMWDDAVYDIHRAVKDKIARAQARLKQPTRPDGEAAEARPAAEESLDPPLPQPAARRLGWLGRHRQPLLVALAAISVVTVAAVLATRPRLPATEEAPVADPIPAEPQPSSAAGETPATTPAAPPASRADLLRKCQAAAQAAGLQYRIRAKDSMPQVLIPAGEFLMGSPPNEADRGDDEGPQKRVRLSAYWMDVHEVTVAQYERFCETLQPDWNKADHPVVNVTWEDARSYAAWVGGSLPTEAQWEKVARGGHENWPFVWGTGRSAAKTKANFDLGDPFEYTSPVVSFEPNGYGLCDLAGNVFEWCQDGYDENWYTMMPALEPVNNISTISRVLRGGSWDDNLAFQLRVADRSSTSPSTRYRCFGFRCVSAP